MIRHYFPGVNINELDDEEFAVLSEEALWLHGKTMIAKQANALSMLS